MYTIRLSIAACLSCLLYAALTQAQEPPKPGPEHERLKQMEGTWEATSKVGGMESKGTMTYKMWLGGLWLLSEYKGEFAGAKFEGKGLEGYDPAKKKYITVWIDSMSAAPLVLEGNYDKAGKVLTMTGEGPGPDGKPMKYKTVSEMKDKDSMVFTLFGPGQDGKVQDMVTITYKRMK
jgi:hypothetical protein